MVAGAAGGGGVSRLGFGGVLGLLSPSLWIWVGEKDEVDCFCFEFFIYF